MKRVPDVSIKVKTPTETPGATSARADEALRRATVQATEGPEALRAGRYMPREAEAFAAPRKPRG